MNTNKIIEEEKEHDNRYTPIDFPSTLHPKNQTLKEARLTAYSKIKVRHHHNNSTKTAQHLSNKNLNYDNNVNGIESKIESTLPLPTLMPPKISYNVKNEIQNGKTDFINQCNEWYHSKINNNNMDKGQRSGQNEKSSLLFKANEQTDLTENQTYFQLSYSLIMINNSPNAFCYHKQEKWFAYICKNKIIIEDLSKETNRQQIFLSNSKETLSCIKLSFDNTILFSYSKQQTRNNFKILSFPFLLFYAYKPEYETKFVLINKCILKQFEIITCEISPKNQIIIILSKFQGGGSLISLLDFYKNEILVTTAMNDNYKAIKWNSYLVNLEFSSISDNILTFWRVNSTDGTLQYQHGGIDFDNYFNDSNIIVSFEFIPPINGNVILLLGDSNGNIYGVNTRTNCLVMKWDLFIFNTYKSIQYIFANLSVIGFIVDNEIKYYHVCFNKITEVAQLFISANDGILSDHGSSLKLDSEVVSVDYDKHSVNEFITLTKNGILYYIDFEEECSVKLFHFLSKKNKILQVAIMKKAYDKYTILSNDNSYENIETKEELINHSMIKDSYYLITAHEEGIIKIWSVPEYKLLYNYETVNEDIICFNNALNDLLFAVAYTNTTVRFFTNDRLIGKFSGKHLSSYASFKYMKFLPDSRYLFLIDTCNSLYLIHIENFEPLLVQFHQILKITNEIIDFNLSLVEYYNNFFFNLQNVFICVYNRKFTNIMHNLTFGNSIPQFYIQDKFNLTEFFSESNIVFKSSNETYTCSFSPNASEKNYLYILSKGRRKLIIRNYETHVIENIIQFTDNIDTFAILNNFKYFILLYTDKIQITSIEAVIKQQKETCNTMIIEHLPEKERTLILINQQYKIITSDNSCIAIIFNDSFIFLYKL